jgi:hypothetical protein
MQDTRAIADFDVIKTHDELTARSGFQPRSCSGDLVHRKEKRILQV